jgi:glycosyltransferase involved in cell wall biosynthesis
MYLAKIIVTLIICYGGINMDIAVVIPAYNEERSIADVIAAVKKADIISKIIVVSDGSSDNTAYIAESMGADVISLERNIGKGGAMKAGFDSCAADVILFLDADLIGLTYHYVLSLLKPIVDNKADMSIGIFKDGRLITDMAQKVTPFLSGQRAVKRSVLEKLHHMDIAKFGIEVALTKYAIRNNIKIEHVILREMSHYTKEEKLGFVKGIYARLKMYYDIFKCMKPDKIK